MECNDNFGQGVCERAIFFLEQQAEQIAAYKNSLKMAEGEYEQLGREYEELQAELAKNKLCIENALHFGWFDREVDKHTMNELIKANEEIARLKELLQKTIKTVVETFGPQAADLPDALIEEIEQVLKGISDE